MVKDLEKLIMQGGDEPESMEMDKPMDSKVNGMSKQDIMAKMDVIRELLEEMQSALGGQVKGGMEELLASMSPEGEMQKVTVAAPNEESLKAGLEMAEEVVPDEEDSEEKPEMPKEKEDEEEDDSLFGKKKDKSKFF